MIKKLDRLILKAFVGPFFTTFIIALFVLTMQFFWKYIDDLVGKGLDFLTIAQLTGLVTATWVPLALPLAILLSSIMTFGNLGESFELVAIKSAGIPLLRFMRPLFWTTVFVCYVAFLFANYIIPIANLKMNTLLYDITYAKPAFDIKEGVFYDKIEGYTLKIGKKDKTGSLLDNIIIFEHKGYGLQDNFIVAKRGVMSISQNQFMSLKLEDGWRYEEQGPRYTTNTKFIRLGFKEYTKLFDLSSFKMNRTPDSAYKDNYRMLSARQLKFVSDSLSKSTKNYLNRNVLGLSNIFHFAAITDSLWRQADTTVKKPVPFAKLFPDSIRQFVHDRAMSTLNSLRSQLDGEVLEYTAKKKNLNGHLIEWHRKYALSAACLVLFLIGAPLGSIIRKGGLGMPLVFAVVFFVIFHLLNTFGEKFVKQEVLSPFTGMWLSCLVLIPVGIFLTYKAMNDSQLFNKEFYNRFFRKVKPIIQPIIEKLKKKKPDTEKTIA